MTRFDPLGLVLTCPHRRRGSLRRTIRHTFSSKIAWFLYHTGCLLALRTLVRLFRKEGRIVILAYHRVGPGNDDASPAVPPSDFERHVKYLLKRFRVIPLEQALIEIKGHAPIPDDAVVLTFDDPYRDHFRYAFPILVRNRVPAIFFLTTEPIESGSLPWYDEVYRTLTHIDPSIRDRITFATGLSDDLKGLLNPVFSRHGEIRKARVLACIESLKSFPDRKARALVTELTGALSPHLPPGESERSILNWAEVSEMDASGMTIGAHTRTHPILTHVSLPEAKEEIRGSKEAIEKVLGHPVDFFAYPNGRKGDFSDETIEIVRTSGYVGSCTTIGAANDRTVSPYCLRRICLGQPSVHWLDFKITMSLLL